MSHHCDYLEGDAEWYFLFKACAKCESLKFNLFDRTDVVSPTDCRDLAAGVRKASRPGPLTSGFQAFDGLGSHGQVRNMVGIYVSQPEHVSFHSA